MTFSLCKQRFQKVESDQRFQKVSKVLKALQVFVKQPVFYGLFQR